MSGDSQQQIQGRYLGEAEAAALLGLKVGTLTVWRCRPPKCGAPAFHKIGRRVVYNRVDLDSWLAARRFQNTTEYSRGGGQ